MTATPDAPEAWIRPDRTPSAQPLWGHADGLQVGLPPLRGPRGLLRIYAPFLGHPSERVINFVAIEPIPAGATQRGYSELEHSGLDGVAGKRLWSADDPGDATPGEDGPPARGVVEVIDGVEYLRVYVLVEPFGNGADVYVRVSFRRDAPYEIGLAAWSRDGSVALDHCVLTATMGNFARLRRLHLADRVATPAELWPDFDGIDFAAHARFPLGDLARNSADDAVVRATSNEDAPESAVYAPDTPEHWKYFGTRAVQQWRVPTPDPALEVLVNGRDAYWAGTFPIPGGTSYENFEVIEPYRPGREYFFGVEPLS